MKKAFFSLLLLLFFAAGKAQFSGALVIGPQTTTVAPAFTYAPDTVARAASAKSGLRVGIITNLPLSKKLFVHTGVMYSTKGSKQQQVFSSGDLQSATTDLNLHYIDMPVNLLLKLPLKGKWNILLGAGPQLSLFYKGSLTHSLIDVDGKFQEIKNEDLAVGKKDGQFRTMHFAANGLAGFEAGRVFVSAHYAQGLTPFYQKEKETFSYTTLGATLGIYLGKKQVEVPVVKDRDKDGVPDSEDACPTERGTAVTNGCPDGDGDGIADKEDKCAAVAGLKRHGGCPVPDTDGDGLNDEEDKCPEKAGLAQYSGCPMPDGDGDGVADEKDACPDKWGAATNAGCPVVTQKVKEKVAHAAHRLQFHFQSATILSQSFKELDEVVAILNEHPQVQIRIEGHTDGVANEANLLLSQQRAQNVKAYLVSKGIATERIAATGYGATRPLIKTTDKTKGAANRRVEIHLSE